MMHQLLTSLAGVFHKSPEKAIQKRLDRDPQGGHRGTTEHQPDL
jgi:hypothetical protein